MKPDMIIKADILDILFENRNKDYGAYELRKNYNSRLIKSIGITMALILMGILFNFWIKRTKHSFGNSWGWRTMDTVMLVIVDPPLPKAPEPVEPPRQKATIQYARPLIVPNDPPDPLPPIESITDSVIISDKTQAGEPPANNIPPSGEDTGNKIAEPATPVTEKEEPLVISEIPPEFPGGAQEFVLFIQRNLKVPEDQLETGQKISVRARFVVDKDGTVTGIEILQSGGGLFDREVKRVLAKMPAWKPGKQNGKNVSVWFSLPVIFQGQAE